MDSASFAFLSVWTEGKYLAVKWWCFGLWQFLGVWVDCCYFFFFPFTVSFGLMLHNAHLVPDSRLIGILKILSQHSFSQSFCKHLFFKTVVFQVWVCNGQPPWEEWVQAFMLGSWTVKTWTIEFLTKISSRSSLIKKSFKNLPKSCPECCPSRDPSIQALAVRWYYTKYAMFFPLLQNDRSHY